jgi:hypothetical protein
MIYTRFFYLHSSEKYTKANLVESSKSKKCYAFTFCIMQKQEFYSFNFVTLLKENGLYRDLFLYIVIFIL